MNKQEVKGRIIILVTCGVFALTMNSFYNKKYVAADNQISSQQGYIMMLEGRLKYEQGRVKMIPEAQEIWGIKVDSVIGDETKAAWIVDTIRQHAAIYDHLYALPVLNMIKTPESKPYAAETVRMREDK